MKKLLLVRHAKAENGHDKSDYERVLTDRGRHDAEEIAKRFKKHIEYPQYILSSPAYRAKATAEIFADAIGIAEVAFNRSIFEASVPTLLKVVNGLPELFNYVMLVGHNPGFSQLIYGFTGELHELSTSDVALIEFDVDEWAEIGADTGKLTWTDTVR